MSSSESINKTFRFTKEELERLEQIGQALSAKGVFGLMTPSKRVNLAALIRYMLQDQERRLHDNER